MAKIVIDLPDNMQDMCRWHTDGIAALTNLEINILVEAVKNGTEVKYGKWISSTVHDSMLDQCSICGFDTGCGVFKYCPMCGSIMRGDS